MIVATLFNLAAVTERAWQLHLAGNRYAVAAAFVAASASVVYLYRAQRRVASRGAVAALTALRLLLVAAAFALLMQPSIRWTRRDTSAGTLWLVVDTSGSMLVTDPQSSPVERLRAAEALGELDPSVRPLKLDRAAAALACLKAELATIDGAERFAAWRGRMTAATDQLAGDAAKLPTLNPIVGSLRQLTAAAGEAVSARRSTVDQQVLLDAQLRGLNALADAADAEVVKKRGDEPAVKSAMAKAADRTRAEAALLQLTRDGAFRRAYADYRVRLLGFAGQPRSPASATADELPAVLAKAFADAKGAGANGTDLAAALTTVAEQSAPDEPTSVVLVSDGRQTTDGDAAAPARQLAAQGAHVYALAAGSSLPVVDAAVESVDAPDWVYKDDAVRVAARVRLDGLPDRPVAVEFWRGDERLDAKTIKATRGRDSQVVRFEDPHPAPGVHAYSIRVPPLAGERETANNADAFRVAVRADQLRVLLVEDQPRWEYRHVVAYLSRDPRVKLQTVLLRPTKIQDVASPAPAKASPANPRIEAQLLPETKEEWQSFDVVMLGDVSPAAMDDAAQRQLLAAVKDAGKALVVVAGPRHMPGAFAGAPLADALPVSLASEWSADVLAEHLKAGFKPSLTPQGRGSVLSQLRGADASTAAFAALPPWYWHGEQTVAKPSATVLWTIADVAETATRAPDLSADAQRRRAMLASSSYGAGRVLYLAADQTWRLRAVDGENLQDRFWGQVIRWASGDDLPAGSTTARFGADQPRYAEGQPIVVTARLTSDQLAPLTGQAFEAVATRRLEPTTRPTTSAAATSVAASAAFVESPDAPGVYKATLTGLAAGHYELSLRGPDADKWFAGVTDERLRTLPIRVDAQMTPEQRDTNADKPKLAELAQVGRGVALDVPYADTLADHLPRPKVEQTQVEQLGLFGDPGARATRLTHWIFLAAFCTLITLEWIIRKAAGLV